MSSHPMDRRPGTLSPPDEQLSFQRGRLTYHVHADALGSVRKITDDSGDVVFSADFDAWGNTLAVTDSVPGGFAYRFVGASGVRSDEHTGLHYMRQRWYDARLGRFTARDRVSAFTFANAYAYADNNPIIWADPFGLAPTPIGPNDIFKDPTILNKFWGHGVVKDWLASPTWKDWVETQHFRGQAPSSDGFSLRENNPNFGKISPKHGGVNCEAYSGRYLQWSKTGGSRHNWPYWKVSSGQTGMIRIDFKPSPSGPLFGGTPIHKIWLNEAEWVTPKEYSEIFWRGRYPARIQASGRVMPAPELFRAIPSSRFWIVP